MQDLSLAIRMCLVMELSAGLPASAPTLIGASIENSLARELFPDEEESIRCDLESK